MDIRQLRYFLAIVDEGAFSRAAARLNIAQPALSLHVRKMEEAIGTPLLIRNPGGVTPTEAGESLTRRARPLVAEYDRMWQDLRNLDREPTGTVRIGLPGTISGILSVPLIARLRERHPRIRLVIAEAMSGFVGEWLEEGRVELAVLYSTAGNSQLQLEPLIQEELVLLLPPDNHAGGTARMTDLASIPMILPSASHGLTRMLSGAFRDAGLSLAPAIEVDAYASIKRLVMEGFGCSILPLHAVADEAAEGRLQIRKFEGKRLWRSAHLASHAIRPLSRAALPVRECLHDTIVELINSGTWPGTVYAARPSKRPAH